MEFTGIVNDFITYLLIRILTRRALYDHVLSISITPPSIDSQISSSMMIASRNLSRRQKTDGS